MSTRITRVSSRKRSTLPAVLGKTVDSMRLAAFDRLGVLPADVAALPRITHILEQLPGGKKRGGVLKAIEFLRGADHDDARRWLAVYDQLPEASRKLLPFEAFCLAAHVTTKRMLEVITGACFEQSSSTSSLLAAAAHPEIVQATVRSAKTLDGSADRKMLHQAAGFVPVPKNQTTIIGSGGVQNNAHTQNALTDNSKNLTIGIGEVMGVESKMAKIANRFNERMGLTSGDAGSLPPPLSDGVDALPLPTEEPEMLDAEWAD